jgi:uncharacterized repeat protein (TIGR02543 family)
MKKLILFVVCIAALSLFFSCSKSSVAGPDTGSGIYALTITAANGTVVKSPSQTSYDSNAVVLLTATPKTGYMFTGWTGDTITTNNPISITMTSAKHITANFSVLTKSVSALQVEANITRSTDYNGVAQIECWVSLLYSIDTSSQTAWAATAEQVPAIVTVNNTQLSLFSPALWAGTYKIDMNAYSPGADYTISVTYNNQTYTQTLKAPGGFTANTGMSQISWTQNAPWSAVDVCYLFGATTYTTSNTSRTLTSPQTIPATAYPKTGNTYEIIANVQNYLVAANPGYNVTMQYVFGTLHGDRCSYYIEDNRTWRITK